MENGTVFKLENETIIHSHLNTTTHTFLLYHLQNQLPIEFKQMAGILIIMRFIAYSMLIGEHSGGHKGEIECFGEEFVLK